MAPPSVRVTGRRAVPAQAQSTRRGRQRPGERSAAPSVVGPELPVLLRPLDPPKELRPPARRHAPQLAPPDRGGGETCRSQPWSRGSGRADYFSGDPWRSRTRLPCPLRGRRAPPGGRPWVPGGARGCGRLRGPGRVASVWAGDGAAAPASVWDLSVAVQALSGWTAMDVVEWGLDGKYVLTGHASRPAARHRGHHHRPGRGEAAQQWGEQAGLIVVVGHRRHQGEYRPLLATAPASLRH